MNKKTINTPIIIFTLILAVLLCQSCTRGSGGGESAQVTLNDDSGDDSDNEGQDPDSEDQDPDNEDQDPDNDGQNPVEPIIELINGDTVSLSLNEDENRFFSLSVPADATALIAELSEMDGDLNLYTRFGAPPTQDHYECRPFLDSGNSEICYYEAPLPGDVLYILVIASSSGSATLKATYQINEITNGIDFGKLPDDIIPWSSWYWPWMDDKDPNLYDDGETLHRYDQYTQSSEAQAWEYNFHGPTGDIEPWYGACHAWAGAACWETQPTVSRYLGGIEFRIRDQKGLMTAAYYNCGKAINHEINVSQPSPGLFWKLLQDEIQGKDPMHGQACPLIGELSYGDQIWNNPIFRYEVNFSLSDNIADGTITIWFSSDALPEYADGTNLYYNTKKYQFTDIEMIDETPTDSGEWIVPTDPELMQHHRPDIIWRPYRPGNWASYTANPQLDQIHLEDILNEN